MFALDHVQIAVPRDAETQSQAFWRDLIGLEEIEKSEPLKARGGLWFRIGAAELHLGVEEPFKPAKKAHPGFLISGRAADDAARIDAIATRLSQAGHPVTWDRAIAGRRRFFTEDPFGNRLEFLQEDDLHV